MSDDGVIFSSIDDYEQSNLKIQKNNIFGNNNFIEQLIWKRRATAPNDRIIGKNHEYILVYSKNINSLKLFLQPRTEKLNSRYSNPDKDSKGDWVASDLSANGKGGRLAQSCVFNIINPITNESYPPPKNKCWLYNEEKINILLNENRIGFRESTGTPFLKRYLSEVRQGSTLATILGEHGFSQNSAKELRDIFNDDFFDFPKPTKLLQTILNTGANKTSTILDFFAGSGTTGHAVINLNREDNGKRKYLLVEMGEYFDTVTKPRIQKVIYSESWKDGKPTTKNGISQIFKYFKLESYEDTLNNLEFTKTQEQRKAFDFHPEAKEDYMLNYSLDVESQGSLLNIDTFSTPFDYKLRIATSSVGETQDTNIDLVETFNYLLGLVVKRIELVKSYLIVEGQNLKKEKILIIWRDGQSSDALNEFFKKMDWSVYDIEFDTIYTNGDNNLDNLRKDEDHYKVKLIEQEFKRLMFGE